MKWLLPFIIAFYFVIGVGVSARPQNHESSHGLSVFGDLKYPADFKHFDYVNPNAPKGGVLSHTGAPSRIPNASPLNFDSLNGYILKGQGASGLDLIFDSLMVRGYDEPSAVYGLVAQNITINYALNEAVFKLRPQARFHDGTRLTALDAAFSLNLLKEKGHPLIALHLKHLVKAVAREDGALIIRFSPLLASHKERVHFLIFLAQLPIFSKQYYQTHVFEKTTLKPPLGSGPYQIGKVQIGRAITYQRRKDYWAKDLAVNRGRWNFDQIRFEYFRDRHSEFEAFKAGHYFLREEYVSKIWAKQYNFPAFREGRVKKIKIFDKTPSGAQGWFINMRRKKFQNPLTREALNYAFDFEWTNRNQFYGLYKRTESFFENSAYKAQGVADDAQILLLKPYGLAKSLSQQPIKAPRSNGSGQDRNLLRRASSLLKQAGWLVKNGKRQNHKGEILTIEFLTDTPSFERIIQPFIKNLKLLGIDASIRIVDASQYQQRIKYFDFDITTRRFSLDNIPNIGLRSFFSSSFADVIGGRNLSGLKHEAVDGLVEKVITAPSRQSQISAARALDRVLRSLYIWIPQWHNPFHHIAYWDIYDYPKIKPLYARGIIDGWWSRQKEANQSKGHRR